MIEWLRWQSSRFGEQAATAALRHVPSPARDCFDPSLPHLGVDPQKWYPAESFHALLDVVTKPLPPAVLNAFVDEAARMTMEGLLQRTLAPFASAMRAPSAIHLASQPASWTTWMPAPCPSARSRASRLPSTRAELAVISEITRPAPRRDTSRRNGASVIPDMGARITWFGMTIWPIFRAAGETGPFRGLSGIAHKLGGLSIA